MDLILLTLNPKAPYNLTISRITQNTALVTWDGGVGNIFVNGIELEKDHLSPFFLKDLRSSTEYKIKIANVSGKDQVMFTTLNEAPLRMNYRDKKGKLAKWLVI